MYITIQVVTYVLLHVLVRASASTLPVVMYIIVRNCTEYLSTLTIYISCLLPLMIRKLLLSLFNIIITAIREVAIIVERGSSASAKGLSFSVCDSVGENRLCGAIYAYIGQAFIFGLGLGGTMEGADVRRGPPEG